MALFISGCSGTTPPPADNVVSAPTDSATTAPADSAASLPVGEAMAETILVTEAWVRSAGSASMDGGTGGNTGNSPATEEATSATVAGETTGENGAVYMTIRNMADRDDKLIKAESNIADAIELHAVEDNNGVMEMRPVPQLDIPAGGEVELRPGGFHVMLIGINQALTPGSLIDVTLQFEQAGAIAVQAEVR
jgi:hypothetical protein